MKMTLSERVLEETEGRAGKGGRIFAAWWKGEEAGEACAFAEKTGRQSDAGSMAGGFGCQD